MSCLGGCVLNSELRSFCDDNCACEEVSVCDRVFGMCVCVCVRARACMRMPRAHRRGVQVSGEAERQPAWLLGETLIVKSSALESGCLTA